ERAPSCGRSFPHPSIGLPRASSAAGPVRDREPADPTGTRQLRVTEHGPIVGRAFELDRRRGRGKLLCEGRKIGDGHVQTERALLELFDIKIPIGDEIVDSLLDCRRLLISGNAFEDETNEARLSGRPTRRRRRSRCWCRCWRRGWRWCWRRP